MNIVLTGFMGTGKSETGRLLARKLGWQFFDTDEMIEQEVGMKVADIFARKGEPYFREAEASAVRLLSLLDRAVISCGGGVVLREGNMDELEKNGVVVCLTATPETIVERTRAAGGRPLLDVKDPQAKVRELLAERASRYKRCRICVPTDGLSPEQVAEKVLKDPAVASIAK